MDFLIQTRAQINVLDKAKSTETPIDYDLSSLSSDENYDATNENDE